jgi:hypothetical protein
MHLINTLERGFSNCTDNFINDPLVRVEVEGKAGIAGDALMSIVSLDR